ncbi:hypothetical protein [Paenibacillus elgii]|uniref:hypothetical protein n=1 Tax=Paenibacillus elgii TaxID=189691 RepID=UPI000248C970|nr:hypothetical protein [Paenibacillus elgii]
MSMNIWKAKKGSKVRFMNRGGYDGDRAATAKVLRTGEIYEVERVEIYQSSTNIYLVGFGDHGFNSVHFDDVDLIDYDRILELTNQEFTEFLRKRIGSILQIRELSSFQISVDDFGYDSDDGEEEADKPTIVFDLMTNGALWTFWFDTDEEKYNYSVLGEDRVNRYLAVKAGQVPELPGTYTYGDENPA